MYTSDTPDQHFAKNSAEFFFDKNSYSATIKNIFFLSLVQITSLSDETRIFYLLLRFCGEKKMKKIENGHLMEM
jgi:hypothetical protein